MAARYYDDAIVQKILRWIPENSNLRVLKPNESKRLFQLHAEDTNDAPIKLPLVALSRSNDIKLVSNIKQLKSYNGLKLFSNNKINSTAVMNVIPIELNYQLDIYTKYSNEADEYLRNFLFKLINNPSIKIQIPYNSTMMQEELDGNYIEHVANIRVLDTVSDTSDVEQRLFSGQFSRWSIQFDLQDAFLFSIPYKNNWIISDIVFETADNLTNSISEIECRFKSN